MVLSAFAAFAASLTSGCIPQSRAAQDPPEQHHPTQSRPTLVSLNPCTDAILAEVADPAQILAISHYSHDPRSSSLDEATAQQFPATRGTVEEVLALKPDIVLGSTFTDPATASAYSRLGLRLERIGMAMTVEENHAQIRQIAGLIGQPRRGEALIGRINAALAAAAPPAGAAPIPTVVWQSGGMVPGDGTLIADVLRRTGFANFAAARGLGQADLLPLERMLADPPALILVAGRSAETGQGSNIGGDDRVLSHPALSALKTTRRAALNPKLLYCGGPTLIAAAQRLAEVRRAAAPLPLAGGPNAVTPLPLAGGVGGGPVPTQAIK
ncbi:ABC transporter substrate-binding protein [Novosphingobium sp.]|uniref:ABC transporter substrate-binding protein n=1 Tax=Novosphingobium sp. TaxID=1874826 RepID=UPI002611284B|nr:ABC transporter substrate-binding protein [Novosphingobium sp.]